VKQPSCELSNTFANVVVREPHDSKKFFISNKKNKDNVWRDRLWGTWKKCEVHSLERKEGRMVNVAQDFLGSGNDTWISWHTGRIGGNSIWWHGKEAGNVDWHDVKFKKNNKTNTTTTKNEHKSVCRPTTMLYSRHCIFWNCGHGKR